ncbi:hypothetical protein O6H91_23G056700 [Diphasiastrum complanatum]|uniref:Uncharacterized protein n=1 Tax=Diphasiastrum complanatum TaxID=34168 RepID=A0ACC2AAZ1_DIPCM|nr:hypothetical protein O6H91_23G056700 [Diphasiastrum complanatum]
MKFQMQHMYKRPDAARDGGIPTAQVRVLVVGDAGVGKSSIVQLLVSGGPVKNPQRTIGCAVDVKLLTYKDTSRTSSSANTENCQDFFVELWDVSGNEFYENCRSVFYSQINGVIFVHDLSQRKTKTNLQKWATEVASLGTFSAPLPSPNIGGIPVPFLVIGNKADISSKSGGSSSNLVDVARHWVEKQGLLPSSDELPTSESFPGTQGCKGW